MSKEHKCRLCGVELLKGENITDTNFNHKMYICKKCVPLELKQRRMFVNGKYVPKSHPLYKPGRYKTFEDAAFSSLAKYELSREGQVYIITNPNFPEWVKVGMAVDSEDRLNGYQTSSPFRDYALFTCWSVTDRRSAESEAHALLEKSFDRKGEWFNCTPEQAQSSLADLMEQHK
jgi:hypothetical protein